MKYTYNFWYIVYAIASFINFGTAINIYSMEILTKNEILLQSISQQLPKETQTLIALFETSEFFLVEKMLAGLTAPIRSISIHNNTVKIELYSDKDGYCGKEEIWDIPTHTLISSHQDSYNVRIGNAALNKSVGYGPLLPISIRKEINIEKKPELKNKTSKSCPLYLNLDTPNFNTEEIVHLIRYELTIPQADLIKRAYETVKIGHMFTIYALSEDGKIFLTLPKNVQRNLLYTLNLKLRIKNWVPPLINTMIDYFPCLNYCLS